MLGILGAALLVNLVAVVFSAWCARKWLGLRPVDAWGAVSGGMMSTAALATVRDAAGSNEPAASHAAAHAVASVLATVVGPIIVRLSGG